jgi:hypothetical protein
MGIRSRYTKIQAIIHVIGLFLGRGRKTDDAVRAQTEIEYALRCTKHDTGVVAKMAANDSVKVE